MDPPPPPPYDPRRLPSSSSFVRYSNHHHHHESSSSSAQTHYHYTHVPHPPHRSYPQLQQSHSTHYPTTNSGYYLNSSSRSTTASESAPRHHVHPSSSSSSMSQLLYRRPSSDVSESNPDPTTRKHHRPVDEVLGSRSMAGSLDQRDRKKARVSGRSNETAVDVRERNSRSSYDNNTVKESSPPRRDYRQYDKEKREICDTERRTPQKPNAKSRISVWNRIEESPSLVASPSSSNLSNRASTQQFSQENKPETEASGQSVAPEKDLGLGLKAAEVSAEVTGKKKKKVVIRRRIVKKKIKSNIDDSILSSSSPVDPIAEGTGSDIVAGGKRRVKRVLLVKKKKGAKAPGETSVCNEELVRQIVNEVFSEKKSGDGSRLSCEKSAEEIESKIDDGSNMSLVVFEKNSSISDGMIGTSHKEICIKEEVVEATSPNRVCYINGIESVYEAPLNLETATQNEENEISFTVGSPVGEDCTKEKEIVSTIGSPVGKDCITEKQIISTIGSPEREDCITEKEIVSTKDSPAGEDRVKEQNIEGDVRIDEGHEMMSSILNYGIENEIIENKMQVDVPREIDINHTVTEVKSNEEKDEEMKDSPPDDILQLEAPKEGEPASVYALSVSALDNCLQLKLQEMCSSDLVLGQYLPQSSLENSLCNSNSLPQTESEGNGVTISTEINENNVPDNKKDFITKNSLSGSSTNEENIGKTKFNQEVIQKYQKEIQKPVYKKSASVSPISKFPVQNPRHRTWRRETSDHVTPGLSAPNQLPKPPPLRDTRPRNSYIRMGHRLIRSASGTTVPMKSSIPRVPSPTPNRPVLDMSREAIAISSPMHESEGEDKKVLETAGIQNINNKVVYYKMKNNQIVLNNGHSSDSQTLKGFIPLENVASTSNLNSDDSKDLVHYLSDSGMTGFLKKSADKAPRRINKVASYPNVWTLSSMQSKRKDGTSATTKSFFKSIPSVLPWKRTSLLKNSTFKRSYLHKSSTSWLIRKLVLAKRRDTVYAVSKDGFSLRKTGVLAVGGSNLKWSRSIEKNSKKACEEATLAVAEVERKKREKRKCASIRNKGKKVAGVKALFATGDKTGNGKRAGLDLNRLSACIGYVRVSKGNQLVRDPKKLVRILASEKIQRSLHTLRNAKRKKQQYCVFYTRFGHCNKTKCHYIHDPAKVAICTKFLRGICVDTNCKLTHQIIPERMPDCSYFLQGLCTNLTCPYRHVNVNPKAPVCEGFQKGYCADGDECRKKHSYTCPEFEEKGKCLLGLKCKLYHPKIKLKPKKRKVSLLQKSASRPRYFESSIDTTEPVDSEKNCDDLFPRGQFGDFVSLYDGSYENGSLLSIDAFEPTKLVQSDPDSSDWEVDDELIKPVRVMRKGGLTVS